jgi:hypothetical protein
LVNTNFPSNLFLLTHKLLLKGQLHLRFRCSDWICSKPSAAFECTLAFPRHSYVKDFTTPPFPCKPVYPSDKASMSPKTRHKHSSICIQLVLPKRWIPTLLTISIYSIANVISESEMPLDTPAAMQRTIL